MEFTNILAYMIFAYMAKRNGRGYTADRNLKEEMVAWVVTGSWKVRQEDGSTESEKTHSGRNISERQYCLF